MRVIEMRQSGLHYTSRVYLVLGTWNRLSDINTLVDVGRDPTIVLELRRSPTGVGKRKVDLVILTHSHYDHSEMLPQVRAAFGPQVWALSGSLEGVDRILSDGEVVTMGDEEFEVIAVHAHSSDSLCLYSERTGTLFSGDAPLIVSSADHTCEPAFLAALQRIAARDVRIIYPGHGAPVTEGCNERLRSSIRLIDKALITKSRQQEDEI